MMATVGLITDSDNGLNVYFIFISLALMPC